MTAGHWLELSVAGIALVIVFLSAWVETSLAAVTKVNLRALLEGRTSRSQESEVEGPHYTRSAMLLVEMVGVGVATALITHVLLEWDAGYGLWAGLLIATALHIVVGRILPRIAAGDERSEQSNFQKSVARFLSVLFAPLIRPVDAIVGFFLRRMEQREEAAEAAGELDDGVAISTGNGHDDDSDEIEPVEQEMISGILHLDVATASEIMVPRIDIVAVPSDATIEEAAEVAISAGHSRIPVYGQSMDEIQGIVYAKDLLRYVTEDTDGETIESILRPVYYVPESKPLDDLLRDLQRARIHMAVVVDEYGGTAGLVTIEDIIEEIVGEIEDEYDTEQPYIEVLSDTEALVAGKVSVDDFMRDLDLDLPVAPTGTVGGLVQRELGHIPRQGESLEIGDVRLTVMEVEHRRIRQVKVERLTRELHEHSGVSDARAGESRS